MSNKDLRVGIFLGYAPEQRIIDQGIGRLLGFVVEGLAANHSAPGSIAIACPDWYRSEIRELLEDLRIPDNVVRLVTTDGVPYLLRLRVLYRRMLRLGQRRRRIKGRWRKKLRQIIFVSMLSWLGTTSTLSFIVQGVALGAVGLVVGPIILLLMLLGGLWNAIAKGLTMLARKLPGGQRLLTYASSPLRTLRRDDMAISVYESIREQEFDRLVRKINRTRPADVWYCPTIFWPAFAKIVGPKVVAVPDIVFVDFPLGYSKKQFAAVFEKAEQIVQAGTHLVCYSEHVRDNHLVNRLGVSPRRVSVIRHGAVALSQYIPGKSDSQRRASALEVLHSYVRKQYRSHPYLGAFDFTDVRFGLYASQARPHKNLLVLVRAWESLIRERYCGAKLVLTCRLEDDATLSEYVHEKRLQYDVLVLSGVPSEVLAALNLLATIAVNPSLFEGGFPFSFPEAYSVGTPSIMSRIPVVLEQVRDPILQKAMLFDPHDVDSICERAAWALANRQELYEMQRGLYEEFANRDWRAAAADYLALFERVANVA